MMYNFSQVTLTIGLIQLNCKEIQLNPQIARIQQIFLSLQNEIKKIAENVSCEKDWVVLIQELLEKDNELEDLKENISLEVNNAVRVA